MDTEERKEKKSTEFQEDPSPCSREDALLSSEEAFDPSDSPNAEESSSHGGGLSFLFDFVELLAFAVAAIVLLFTFVLRTSVVDGTSMQHTLENQDRLLVTNFFYVPQKGDLVVIQAPYDLISPTSNDILRGQQIIKRIVAMAGDSVSIMKNGEVYVNGVLEDGSVLGYESFTDGSPGLIIERTLVVPDGAVFVMGDHRNNSLDSRYFGCVDARCIQGKAVFRMYPFDTMGPVH